MKISGHEAPRPHLVLTQQDILLRVWVPWAAEFAALRVSVLGPHTLSIYLDCSWHVFRFFFVGSVHFYWGLQKNKVFSYHIKSRDDIYIYIYIYIYV